MLEKLIAFPESKRILKIHLISSPFTCMYWGLVGIIPVLLRKDFGASAWQTAAATAAIPVLAVFAIFWNEVYRRVSPRQFLLAMWVLTHVPLGLIALCHRPATVLACLGVSAMGVHGMNAFNADLMRSCYPPSARSKSLGAFNAVGQFSIMVTAYTVGLWLDVDTQAFRTYLPVAVVLLGIGMWLTARITLTPLFKERHVRPPTTPLLTSLRQACHNMIKIFREDEDFRQYEVAFTYYGTAFMFCVALTPFLVWDELHLPYTSVARSTQVAFQLTLLLTIVPVGYLMDRLGVMRVAGWSFCLLTLYPLGLMLATGEWSLAMVTVFYGATMTGVQLAWTMGPITLAKDASQAPTYLAIHAAMVGPRAIAGQLIAVGLYKWTGRIEVPLAVAAVLFAAGGVLMVRLDRKCRANHRAALSEKVAPVQPQAV